MLIIIATGIICLIGLLSLIKSMRQIPLRDIDEKGFCELTQPKYQKRCAKNTSSTAAKKPNIGKKPFKGGSKKGFTSISASNASATITRA